MKKFITSSLVLLIGGLATLSAQISSQHRVPARVEQLSEEWTEIGTGKYSDNIIASKYGTVKHPIDVKVEESTTRPGVYRVVNPWPDAIDEDYLIINASDPDYVIVEKQRIAFKDENEGVIDIASYSWICQDRYHYYKDEFLAVASDLNITLKEGMINFPPLSVSFQYPEAPRDSEYRRTDWYDGSRMSGYLALPGVEVYDPYPWESIGVGYMMDNILAPMFQLSCTSPYQVVIEQSTENEHLFRVLNPWAVVAYTSSPLVFDLTDPKCVLVALQTSGFATELEGRVWLISRSACFDTREKFLASDEGKFFNITFSDNRISIPAASIATYLPDFDEEAFYFPEEPADSYIDFPEDFVSSLRDVHTTASPGSDKVEYYNMQGIRIQAPVKGQTVIRRSSHGVEKIIIR